MLVYYVCLNKTQQSWWLIHVTGGPITYLTFFCFLGFFFNRYLVIQMTYEKNMFGLHSQLPKPVDISWVIKAMNYYFFSCPLFLKMLQKMHFGSHPRVGAGCQENQPCDERVETFSREGRRAGDWVRSPMANDVINHAYVV